MKARRVIGVRCKTLGELLPKMTREEFNRFFHGLPRGNSPLAKKLVLFFEKEKKRIRGGVGCLKYFL